MTAIIENGKVINIIEGEVNRIRFPLGQFTWDCGGYPVAIGDDFSEGVFSREGQPLEIPPTAEQLKIAELEQQITDLQLALVSLYEGAV
jgi:hypothetical protein